MAAFGMQVSSGQDFLDYIKYDARAGRMFRVDRDPVSGIREQVDITGPGLKFAIDFGSLQVGYVALTVNGPVRNMVPYGKPLPAQPQEKDDAGKFISTPGFYVLVAGKAVGGVREFVGKAGILVSALDELYQIYDQAPEAAQGKIPLVTMPRTLAVKSGRGERTSTNYKPEFAIVGWVDRLAEFGERTVPAPRQKTAVPQASYAPQAADTLAADAEALREMTGAKQPAMAEADDMPF